MSLETSWAIVNNVELSFIMAEVKSFIDPGGPFRAGTWEWAHTEYREERERMYNRYLRALNMFHQLPLQYRFDSILTEVYRFREIDPEFLNVSTLSEVTGLEPLSEFAGEKVYVVLRNLQMALNLVKRSGALSDDSAQELSETIAMLDQLVKRMERPDPVNEGSVMYKTRRLTPTISLIR
ncbi:MAG: hypothetical protein HRT45_11090 [Bdellovibrionales bacterium]|nr:hypothetical protein [Bdellovibrionales bacterium]